MDKMTLKITLSLGSRKINDAIRQAVAFYNVLMISNSTSITVVHRFRDTTTFTAQMTADVF